MKKAMLLITSCLGVLYSLAQVPVLPTKAALSDTLLTTHSFTNASQVDTVMIPHSLPDAFTLEIKGQVNSASGRGLDLEARNAARNGFRLSLDAAHLSWTAPLSASVPWTLSRSGEEHTIRIAVQHDSAHVYQNGAYILSQPLTEIKDIADGVEADATDVATANLAPGWAGVSGSYTGTPADYGWAYTGTTTTLFNSANSSSGVRFLDVNASSGSSLHTYNGTTYNGRILYIRWDGTSIQNTVYSFPVTLEANTSYDFSMLCGYVNNATGTRTMTVGIGKTTAAADRYATHVFTTSGTRDLQRDGFDFTSQEAGTYYLTFTGDYALFSIAELSVNKDYPGSLIPNWAGLAPNTSGYPGDYSWAYTGTTVTDLFNTANAGSGVRYMDINASSGSNAHTYNGAYYDGRLMYIRWDNNSTVNTVYNYPVMLEANTVYSFSMLHAYINNAGTGPKTMTVGIGTSTATADRIAAHTFYTSGTKELYREGFTFTSQAAGLYYLTITGDWAIFSIGDLSLFKKNTPARFLFGKNYASGAVNMQLTSVTYEAGAYAPASIVTGTTQTVHVTGTAASYLPGFNTSYVVDGKTDMHLTGDYSPLVNSTVALNSNDAWLFFDNIKPSVVQSSWLSKVTINGSAATTNPNLRLAIYQNGTVLIPNGNVLSQAALEVYDQPGLTGNAESYAIELYHDSLGAFDNHIRSFKLHRGYMATLATNADGTGYSRVFVANDSDLIINAMPAGLDTTVSFIRVFKWDWVSKKGWAGGGTPVTLTNATWFYDWNVAGTPTSDYNYAMIRHNAGWPSWSDIDNRTNINHLLGFNEPDQADQANMTVDAAIAQWPEMMKSGTRIGSPAPANPSNNWLPNFIATCDSLNYRVDYCAIHCYWNSRTPQQWYDGLKSIYDKVKRPLWITEWNNGANWTGESWPSDPTAAFLKQLNDIKGILQVLDTTSFVERYSIYNWVEDKRAMVLADTLTPAGKYYAANKSALAYNPQKAYEHNWQLAAPWLSASINNDDYFKVTLSFRDINGELGARYVLERKINLVDTGFLSVHEFTDYTTSSTLSYVDSVFDQATYRIKAYDRSGTQFVYSRLLDVLRDADPIAPTSLTGFALSAAMDSVFWNAGTNARSYNLKRSLSAGGPFTTIAARTTQLAFEDDSLQPATTYYYVVTALNSAGESTNADVLSVTTQALVTPDSVINPQAASGDGEVILTWDFQYDATYRILRAFSAGGSYDTIATDVATTRYVDAGKTNGTTYYYRILAYNAAGSSPLTGVLPATPQAGQHLYISFDENAGSFARDQWGGYQGTLAATATWTTGQTNSAVSLDGTATSYVSLGYAPVSTLTDFTITAWVKMSALSNWMRIFDFGSGTSQYMFLTPQANVTSGQSTVRFVIKNGGAEQQVNYAYTWALDTWTHLAVTQSGDTARLYINDSLVATNTNVTIKPADLGLTSQNYIGKSQYSDPLLQGAVDELVIYNRALSASELSTARTLQAPIAATTLADPEPEPAAGFVLYPNPAGDYLHLQFNNRSSQATVKIFNTMGALVLTQYLRGSNSVLSLKGLPAGIYHVQVNDGGSLATGKFIKQ